MQPSTLILDFDQLSARQVYAILELRQDVFIVEQNCVFKDIDQKDQDSRHILITENEEIVAYCRLLPKGVAYAEYSSIGRVVCSLEARKKGYGKLLMKTAIAAMVAQRPVKIGAQQYLKVFYEELGFVQSSEPYLEDGIWHIEMVLE